MNPQKLIKLVPGTPIDANTKHLLRLIRSGRNTEGWTKVSKTVWPLIAQLEGRLVEIKQSDDGGFVKLSYEGNTIVDWLI